MLETGVRVLRLLTAAVTARPLSILPVHEQLADVQLRVEQDKTLSGGVMETDPNIPRHFLTVHGVGYRFLP